MPRPVSPGGDLRSQARPALPGGGAPGPLDRGLSSQASETYLAADGSAVPETSTSRQADMFFASAGPTAVASAAGRAGRPEQCRGAATYCPGPADTDCSGPSAGGQHVGVGRAASAPPEVSRCRGTVISRASATGYAQRVGRVLVTLERVRAGTAGRWAVNACRRSPSSSARRRGRPGQGPGVQQPAVRLRLRPGRVRCRDPGPGAGRHVPASTATPPRLRRRRPARAPGSSWGGRAPVRRRRDHPAAATPPPHRPVLARSGAGPEYNTSAECSDRRRESR